MPPIAIGGVGGSGTRLIAELIRAMGVHLGSDLNQASDTLCFTLLFKRLEILDCRDDQFDLLTKALLGGLQGDGRSVSTDIRSLILDCARSDREQHSADWLSQRADALEVATESPPHNNRWGWKEPNTHVVIERLWQRLPTLKYVHVVRHGVDMAFSSNQNQLRLWGAHVLGGGGPVTPARSLAYWCRVHQRMQRLVESNPERMYWLNYDAFCRKPRSEMERLFDFLGCQTGKVASLLPAVGAPGEPRHASQQLHAFSAGDIAYVRSLGYDVMTRV